MITITPTQYVSEKLCLVKKWAHNPKSVNKVLPTEGTLPKFEVTAEGTGTLAGVQVQMMSTYHAEMRADGSMYGELPPGLVTTSDGVATFRATGSSQTEDGGSKFRGACHFEQLLPL